MAFSNISNTSLLEKFETCRGRKEEILGHPYFVRI